MITRRPLSKVKFKAKDRVASTARQSSRSMKYGAEPQQDPDNDNPYSR
jgi:hypothetical protein